MFSCYPLWRKGWKIWEIFESRDAIFHGVFPYCAQEEERKNNVHWRNLGNGPNFGIEEQEQADGTTQDLAQLSPMENSMTENRPTIHPIARPEASGLDESAT